MHLSMVYFILYIIINLHFSHASIKGLNGIHLNITAYNNPPYEALNLNPNGTYTASGLGVIIFEWLSQKLNFSYSIVDPIVDKDLISKYNIFELAFAKLVNKEVDGILGGHAVNPDKAARMDYTSMIWSEPYTLVVRKPRQQSRLLAFIRPFQPTTWISLLISVVLIIAAMSCFSLNFLEKQQSIPIKGKKGIENSMNKQTHKSEKLINTVGFYGIYAMNILTNHGMYTPFSQHSFRILAACWLLAALVLVNSYSSIVVSYLTIPTMESAINTFDDLANSKDVSIIIQKNVVLGQIILSATAGILKTLGDQARRNPNQQLHNNFPSLIENLATGRFAYPFLTSFNRNFVVQQYNKDGTCRFQLSPPLPISSDYFCTLFQKKFPHTATLSLGLTYLWETGITRHWVEHEMPNVYECFDQNQKPTTSINKVVPIKLEDLASAFFILGIGMGLGLLVFLVELVMKCNCTRNKLSEVA